MKNDDLFWDEDLLGANPFIKQTKTDRIIGWVCVCAVVVTLVWAFWYAYA